MAKQADEKNVQTTEDVKKANKLIMSTAEIDAAVKAGGKELAQAKKVKVKLPKYLAKRLGPVLPIGINGAVIYIGVDGKDYEVPEPYKAVLDESIENLNI